MLHGTCKMLGGIRSTSAHWRRFRDRPYILSVSLDLQTETAVRHGPWIRRTTEPCSTGAIIEIFRYNISVMGNTPPIHPVAGEFNRLMNNRQLHVAGWKI